jgi:radical SAM superfamily enzyme YgiQ (UPF0313 family)
MTSLRRIWFAETTTLVARNERLLRTMRKSGCRGIYLGVESVSQGSLNGVKKGFNRTGSYPEIVQRLHDNGIAAHAGIVLGFDHDDSSTFDETLEYIFRCRFDSASIKILTPYPGTRLHDAMSTQGRIINADMDDYDEQHVVFRPKNMSPDELYAGYRRVVKEFYSMSSILRRVGANLRALGGSELWAGFANMGWRKEYYRSLGI